VIASDPASATAYRVEIATGRTVTIILDAPRATTGRGNVTVAW
jgi:hypothetical protein